ncbi:MAG: glycosyltransferase [Verrucomicrobiota bacterium]|nr:glycosyltransferase [Verrucomicrobiota bacterium]
MIFHSVVIASINRPSVLDQTISSFLSQTVVPNEILICLVSESDVSPALRSHPLVKILFSAPGLTRQLNRALTEVNPNSNFISIFDDDVELASDYLQRVQELFKSQPDLIACDGLCLRDGDVTREESILILKVPTSYSTDLNSFTPYGCNMNFRKSVLTKEQFDEALPLYSWLFEPDFFYRIAKHGKIGRFAVCRLVHLNVQGGRIAGVQFGYSQIINPLYLYRKGTLPRPFLIFFKLILLGTLANFFGIFLCDSKIDRKGRLIGNLLGLWHALQGRFDPTYITNLK